MGFLAVIVAALAGFGCGAVWYMSLSKPWMAAAGIKTDADGRPEGGSPLPFVVAMACMVVVAGMMRHVFAMSGIETVGAGLVSGLGIGAFFIAPWVGMNYAYSMRPMMLWIIDAGYSIIACGIMGTILTLF